MGDERWGQHGSLSVGLLKGPAGRCRRIHGDYKRQMMIEARNHIGRGAKTPRQIIIGMTAAEKTSPRLRLTLKQRKACKRKGASATPSDGSKHAAAGSAYRFEHYEQLTYFYDSRRHAFVFLYCFVLVVNKNMRRQRQAQRNKKKRGGEKPG